MSAEEYDCMHRELGLAFSLYIASQLDSPLHAHLTGETALIFQTDDPDFNAHELQLAKECRKCDDNPDRPVTLIHVRVPRPPSVEDVDWSQAKVLARLVIKAEQPQQVA